MLDAFFAAQEALDEALKRSASPAELATALSKGARKGNLLFHFFYVLLTFHLRR
jgi:hypothetical protein